MPRPLLRALAITGAYHLLEGDKWKDEWTTPRLTNPVFVAREEVGNELIAQMEVWKALRGYYVYFRYHTGHLELSSGPHKREDTARRKAKEAARVQNLQNI